MDYAAGVNEAIYIQGLTLATPPMITPRFFRAEDRKRARNGRLYRDMLQPDAGYPMLLKKLGLSLSWAVPNSLDIEAVNDLISWGGPVDVCYWKPLVESFYIASGASLAGYLTRRNALTTVSPLPTDAATRFAVTAKKSGSPLTVALGTPDAYGVTPWTAVGSSTGERVAIAYVPAFRMVVAEDQQEFTEVNVEPQTLQLEEA